MADAEVTELTEGYAVADTGREGGGVGEPGVDGAGASMSDDSVEYKAESATAIVDEFFSGKFPIAESLQRLRTRLLDLSPRNRLLSYRHPKGRSVQFVDNPDLDLLFERLTDGRSILVKPVPDANPLDYDGGRKPDARQFAERIGKNTSVEFPEPRADSSASRRTPALQALFYPAELDRLLRKIASEARTVIEETGTNMLYLVFGFLEFYDTDDSERPFLAPLISMPVALTRGAIDPDSRAYQYTLAVTGEDVAENHTLREKLKQDFRLNLPELHEDDTPEDYLRKIAQAVRNKNRWKVKRQLSLGFLSFGKLAIWVDLDPTKWPSLLEHPLLKRIFEGRASATSEGTFHAEDYEIDQHTQADHPLIYDADSSQHSALIDVLAGKNMVINGPPGTGKSQTITNIIASAINQGKKVLFVSEKLAALEVVRHRLERAKLGHFCLELHSHKTQKKRLLADIEARIEERFQRQPFVQNQVAALAEHKKRLNRYAEIMAGRFGNELSMTVHEVFWAAEHRRQKLGEVAERLSAIVFRNAQEWAYWDMEQRGAQFEALGSLYEGIGGYGSFQAWWGFTPRALSPGDDVELKQIVGSALIEAEKLVKSSADYAALVGQSAAPSLAELDELLQAIECIPLPPKNLRAELLPQQFSDSDANGQGSQKILERLSRGINQAEDLLAQASAVLAEGATIEFADLQLAKATAEALLAPSAFALPLDKLNQAAAMLSGALDEFEQSRAGISAPYALIHGKTLSNLRALLEKLAPYDIKHAPLRELDACQAALSERHQVIAESLRQVREIARRFNLPFDQTGDSVARLAHMDVLDGMLSGTRIDAALMADAMAHATGAFCGSSLAENQHRCSRLNQALASFRNALNEIRNTTTKVGLGLDDTCDDVVLFGTVVSVAQAAPQDLLEHRHPAFANRWFAELAIKAEQARNTERMMRSRLEELFYLDTLPATSELTTCVRVFRRGDGLFNFLSAEWRAARRLFREISKDKKKKAAQHCEQQIAGLLAWIEHCESFKSNPEFKSGFGTLFAGLATDFEKIRRLHSWYTESQAAFLAHPGLIESIDLSQIEPQLLKQLAARGDVLQRAVSVLRSARETLQHILGDETGSLASTQSSSWTETFQQLESTVDSLSAQGLFFSRLVEPEVSPSRAVELLQATLALQEARPYIDTLVSAKASVAEAAGVVLNSLEAEPGGSLADYLDSVETICRDLQALVRFLGEYVSPETTPEAAESFIAAKLGLDMAWSELSTSSRANDVTSWDEFAARARSVAGAAKALHESVVERVRPGSSASDAFSAIYARDSGLQILAQLKSDEGILRVTGGGFPADRAELNALTDTHDWGRQVAKLARPKHDFLRRRLLCTNGPETLLQAASLLMSAKRVVEELHETLGQLRQYGGFDWDVWQQSVRSSSGQDVPDGIKARLDLAHDNAGATLAWSRYLAARQECVDAGLADLVTGLEAQHWPASSLRLAFEYVVYQSIGKSLYRKFLELAQFAGTTHEKLRKDFIALDHKIIEANGKEFAYSIDKNKRVIEGGSGARAGDYTEMNLIRRELNKQRRHIPIRQLIKRAGRTLQELKPCFMMGPLSVAQYLEAGALDFDIVVMDEASQLRPEEALGAIARGKQLVVVGDPKQLPPTSFFDRLTDGSEDEESDDTPTVVAGMESILDICQQLFHPVRTLRWHYRSRHESLIAFSNHHFYKNLIVFPSPYEKGHRLGVRFRYVVNGVYKDRQNLQEAQCVVDAVVDHMIEHPSESLGVVTLNQTQRELIDDLLDKKLRTFEEGQCFLTAHEKEGWPFFVKNLENVQGDERDVIFISTTFGKAAGTDKVRQNFGPISRPDGWRRLNVLFTRARYRIAIFSSMRAEDIVVEDKTPLGTKTLRAYLDYARRGVLTTTDEGAREPDSDFEIAVANVLQANGYTVKPQLGVSGFFIDMAVRNPDRPGEFLAAIECDGATYHSSASARDRDRIRQEILERLGWENRIYRIWSTDWFYDPRRETHKLLEFLELRRARSQAEAGVPLDEEDWAVATEETAIVSEVPVSFGQSAEAAVSASADVFVEIGDRVTYCFVDDPKEKHSVLLVDSESNLRMNILNENTPVAQVLLGMTQGEEGPLEVPDRPKRMLRVLKIQREKEDVAVVEEEATTHQREAAPPTLKESDRIRAQLPVASTDAPSLLESGRAAADEQNSRGPSAREVQGWLPGIRSSNVTRFASNEDRKPIAQTAASGNRVLEELRNLDPRFRDPRCSRCGQTARLAITHEGVVVTCKKCSMIERVDTDTLQHLVDRLVATCFSCTSGKLKSMARSFGNILKCQNPECGSNNSWQGLSERIRR